MMASAGILGRFVWHELTSRDGAAAALFYQRVLGWTTQTFEHDPDYRFLIAPHGAVGGLVTLGGDAPAGSTPGWLPYVGTADLHGTLEQATRLGGRTLQPAERIETIGRIAMLQDPQGAALMLIEPLSNELAPELPAPPGGFAWHELQTSDPEAALAFYGTLFGWQSLERRGLARGPGELSFGVPGHPRGGMITAPAGAPHWLCYVRVRQADQAAQCAREAGARLVRGPMDGPAGERVAQLTDPQGAAFTLYSMRD
jgi:uncharacterized protein